jgi:trimeric autotransporter adhesin
MLNPFAARRVSALSLFVLAAALGACGRSSLPKVGPDGAAGSGSAGRDGASADGADARPNADAPADTAANADGATSDSGSGVAGADGGGAAGADGGGTAGADGGGAVVARIEISPPAVMLAKGTELPVTVTADFTDGTSSDVSALSVLTSNAMAVATVSGRTVNAIAAGMATITATYMGKSATANVTVTAATLQSITIDPAAPTLAAGSSIGLVATGVFSDGSKQDVSQIATWMSSDATVAAVAVGAAGVRVTGAKAGTATVAATLLNLGASAGVTVTSAVIQSLDITPSHPTIPVGISTQFQATATYSDNTTQDVSSQVTWTLSDASIATVSATGSLSTKAMGSVDLQAALGGVAAKTTVIVMGTSLVSIAVTPASVTVPAGVPQQFAAMGTYSDGSVVDITRSVSWSTDAAAASVSNAAGQAGLATGISAGTAHVQAKLGAVTGAATMTVTSAIVTSLAVQPKTATLPVGFTQVLTATATYSDATKLDVTSLAVWSSSDATVATVANASSGGVASGTVTSVKVGAATITATFGGSNDTALITTTAAVITEIDVMPSPAMVVAGRQQVFTATAKLSDGTTSNVTTQVTWSSSATTIATISNAASSKGLATALRKGTSTITATLGAKMGTAELDVSGPVLQSLQVTPFIANIKVGTTQAFTATAIYSDGTTADVTGDGLWSLSDSSIASINLPMMGPVTRAVITGVATGSATLQATYGGLTASALLQVTAPVTLVSIVVTPPTPSLRVGQTQAFTAQAVFSDGSTTNVTAMTAWTSSDTTIATVAMMAMGPPGGPGDGGPGGGGAAGTATGVAAGTVTITATYMGLTATAKLTVTMPQLVSVQVSPPLAALVIGQSQQFQATAIYDDGSRQTVTTTALWSSSAPNILAVSDTGGGGGPGGGGGGGTPKGFAVALAAGKATVTATYNGLSGTASVTVTAPMLVAVQVTPTNPTIAQGSAQQFQAVALYNDFSTVNVTATANWVSDMPTVATITNTAMGPGGGRGRATGVSAGTATITATYNGVSGNTKLTVTNPQVMTLQVTPATSTVPVGINQLFTATAVYTDASTVDVTANVTWSSSDPTIVALSNAMGTQGTATSLAPGTVTVTASYMGMMGTATATVSTASLMGIVVMGVSGTLGVGAHVQLTATATFDDGSMFDVTRRVTWISTSPGVATVSNATGSTGFATGVSAGTTSIEAHFEGMVGTESLSVGP